MEKGDFIGRNKYVSRIYDVPGIRPCPSTHYLISSLSRERSKRNEKYILLVNKLVLYNVEKKKVAHFKREELHAPQRRQIPVYTLCTLTLPPTAVQQPASFSRVVSLGLSSKTACLPGLLRPLACVLHLLEDWHRAPISPSLHSTESVPSQ